MEQTGGGASATVNTRTVSPPAATARRRGWTERSLPLLLIGLGLAAYLNSFSGTFILDDQTRIINNPQIRQLWPPWRAMAYTSRPILNLSLAINYALGGLNVRGYHAFNLAVHLLAGLLLLGIARRTLESQPLRARYGDAAPWLALAVAALWVVHPLQTEAVTYVIQRAESLMGLFFLLTLYCVIRGSLSPHPHRWYVAAVLACVLGMGSKEVMVVAPIVTLLYDRVFLSTSFGNLIRERWKLYFNLATTWAVLAALLLTSRPEAQVVMVAGLNPWRYAITQYGVIVHYLGLALWPRPLVLDYSWPLADSVAAVAPQAAVVLALVVGTLWALRRQPPLGFLGAWFFLILAPTSSILPIGDVAFEHRMYLPLAAVVALGVIGAHEILGTALRRIVALDARRGWLEVGLLVLALAALGAATARRNEDYRSEFSIWSDTVAKRPENPRALNNLGALLVAQGKHREAFALYSEAVRLKPDYPDAHNNLGAVLAGEGRIDEAIAQYSEALRLAPGYPDAHNNLGAALAAQGRTGEAIAHYVEALRVAPNYPDARNNLGAALFQQGRVQDAIAQFSEALRLKPDYPDAHNNLGAALMGQGRIREAMAHFSEAVRLKPDYPDAHNNLGAALLRQGRIREAMAQFSEAVRLKPTFSDAYYNLGLAMEFQGNVQGATTLYSLAVRLNPGNAAAHNSLGVALYRQGQTADALAHFSEAVRLKPDFTEALDNLRKARAGQQQTKHGS